MGVGGGKQSVRAGLPAVGIVPDLRVFCLIAHESASTHALAHIPVGSSLAPLSDVDMQSGVHTSRTYGAQHVVGAGSKKVLISRAGGGRRVVRKHLMFISSGRLQVELVLRLARRSVRVHGQAKSTDMKGTLPKVSNTKLHSSMTMIMLTTTSSIFVYYIDYNSRAL